MVFVKVRETYDLHTITNKMSLIAIHTPDPTIIKRNFSGLLMNCKFYRPVQADVTLACASVVGADPLQVGVNEGDIAPEDLFNPILYKACTNESFSLLESRILSMNSGIPIGIGDVSGDTAKVETNNGTPYQDDFGVYYGLLADAHGWRHAMPQAGLQMTGLKPLVHEVLANFGMGVGEYNQLTDPIYSPNGTGSGDKDTIVPRFMRGNAKPMPRIPTTAFPPSNTEIQPGFGSTNGNSETEVPSMRTLVGCIIVPPSRLHELYYRMVVEWTIEFSEIRSIIEIAGWAALNSVGENTHFQDYNYGSSKTVSDVKSLAAANVELDKVM